jgi:AAA domain
MNAAELPPDDLAGQWAEQLRADALAGNGVDRGDLSWMTSNTDILGVPITWARDYAAVQAPVTIVTGLLEAGTLAVMFGEANSSKSTLALDMALSVARGAPWRGHRTRAGFVLWLALESAAGLRRRVAAYLQHHRLADVPLHFADTTAPLRLLELGDIERLVQTVRDAQRICGQKVALVVVDTVARALAGGDENDGRAMGTLIRGCDQIRTQTGATVLLVHHSGKDATRGARGHSSLRAAVDTEIEVTGQANPRQAKVTKQRDLPSGQAFAYDIEPVEIGRDLETGEAITACVVVHRDYVPRRRTEPNGRNQQLFLGGIRERVRTTGSTIITTPDLRDIAKAQGLTDRRRFSEAREGLDRDGWIVPCVGGHQYEGDKL